MITGDNVITATAIANELGIYGKSMQWIDLEWMTDAKVSKLIDEIWVFARVSPRHKQRIIKILQEKWHIVSMTGDWVNDAPALKYADIWLAMWITWTDVSKEASDLILMDDNFSTIVSAIEEWRWIYDNIKKFVNYLLSTNFAEILIIFISTVVWFPLPLIAIQILWINLITDWFPALALWVDAASPNIMTRRPRNKWSKIVDTKMLINIIVLSLVMTISALYIFGQNYDIDLAQARTWVFVLLTMMEMLRIWMIRDDYGVPFWSNKWLFGAIGMSIWLVMLVVYVPFLAAIFKTVPLSGAIWTQIWVIFIILIWLWWITNRIKKLQRKKK
jgi:Ca2+-transporting ATPase